MTSISAAAVVVLVTLATADTVEEPEPSRQSGFLYLGKDRRLKLPPGAIMVLTPTLSLPMGRGLPLGFGSSMTVSIPFRINFDDLGMTSELNTFGMMDDKPSPGDLAGGERGVLYKVVEESLESVGLDGKACLLRAICEMFELPLPNHGIVGEVLEMFFSASRTPGANTRLKEYTEAEGRGKSGQDCSVYHWACPFSFFSNSSNTTNFTDLADYSEQSILLSKKQTSV